MKVSKIGIKLIKSYNGTSVQKWQAQICSNYKNIHIGYTSPKSSSSTKKQDWLNGLVKVVKVIFKKIF